MSIKWMSDAWENSSQKGASLLLLICLADYANEEGIAWPSLTSLAKKTRLSVRHVQSQIKGLADAGELKILSFGTGRETTQYQLCKIQGRSFCGGSKISGVNPSSSQGRTPVHPRDEPQFVQSPIEPPMNGQVRTPLADFDLFWQAYPNKKAKPVAMERWRKIRPSAETLELMLGAIETQRETRQWQEGIIPHPATWLNQRRWEDEHPENLSTLLGGPIGSTEDELREIFGPDWKP